MKKNAIIKTLAIGIIILFFGASIVPSISGINREPALVNDESNYSRLDNNFENIRNINVESENQDDTNQIYPYQKDTVFFEGKNNKVDISRSDYFGIKFTASLGEFSFEEINVENEIYQRICLSSCGYTQDVGKAELPTLGFYVAVPQEAQVQFEYEILDYDIIQDYTIYPSQLPTDDIPYTSEPPFTIDEKFYSSDVFYPESIVDVSPINSMRGCQMVVATLSPFSYNPSEKTLKVFTEISVKIDFVGGTDEFIPERLRSIYFQPLYERFLLNAPNLESPKINNPPIGQTGRTSDRADLLIIVGDKDWDNLSTNYYEKVVPLADWRHKTGIETKIVNRSEICDNWHPGIQSVAIREYMEEAYDTWEVPPSFLLIIGDADQVGVNYMYYHYNETAYPGRYVGTDHWYGAFKHTTPYDFVHTDLFPEIHVGRISVDSASELETVVNKILSYSKTPYMEDENWFNNILLASYNQSDRYIPVNEEVYNHLNGQGYNCNRIYYGNDTHHGETSDIIEAIDDGVFIASHRDHGTSQNEAGDYTGWVKPKFSNDNIAQLSNGQMYPVMFSINCQTGWFDGETDQYGTNYESIGEIGIRDTEGFVSAIAATRTSSTQHNNHFFLGMYDAIFPGLISGDPAKIYSEYNISYDKNFTSDSAYRMAQILNWGQMYMFKIYGEKWSGSSWYGPPGYRHNRSRCQFEMYHVFGDPTMEIWTKFPKNLHVAPQTIVPMGQSDFEIKVTNEDGDPVEFALVCLKRETDGLYLRNVTNASGITTFSINPQSNPYTVNLVVTAPNHLYYEANVSIDVASPDSWPMFHHTVKRTGVSPYDAPDTHRVKWSFDANDVVYSSPAVSGGKVYVGSEDHKLYCIDETTGSKIWDNSTGKEIRSSPCVFGDYVFVGSDDNKMYCFDASTGEEQWSFTAIKKIRSSPIVAYNSQLFFGSEDKKLYCLSLSGSELWNYTTSNPIMYSPAVSYDSHSVYVGSGKDMYCLWSLYPLHPSIPRFKWSFTANGDVYTPAVAYGNLYFGSADGKIHCLNAKNGSEIWTYTTSQQGFTSTPAVYDGKIYIGSYDDNLYCLDAFGNGDGATDLVWKYPATDRIWSSPAVADGKVYFGCYDSYVYCLDASNKALIWKYQTGGSISSSPAIANGRVYIGSDDDYLYSFEENNPPYIPNGETPANTTTGVLIDTDLSWSGGDPDSDSVTYDVFFEAGDSTPDVLVSDDQTGTTYDPTLSYGTTYYWQIVATDAFGLTSYGPIWWFKTNSLPNTPTIVSPSNGAIGIDRDATLNWNGGDPDPGDSVTYDVYFGTTSSPLKKVSNQSATTYDPPGSMDFGTTYYWKIISWDNHGDTAAGPVWSFTTKINNAPNTPNTPTPGNGDVDVLPDVDLTWIGGDPDGDPVTYDVYFGETNPPPQVKWNQTGELYDPPSDLKYYKTYYWKIVAWDVHDYVSIGPTWSFTTIRPTKVYIDDDFDENTPGWDSTHFNSIQDGIDRVAEGGIVYVLNGIFYETCTISSKTINLTGNGISNSIVDGGGSDTLLTIDSSNLVNVTGMKFQNGDIGMYINGGSENNIINNVFNDNDEYGIYVSSSNNNDIITCNTNDNYYSGIYLTDSSYNYLYDNTANNHDSYYGISISQGTQNTLTENTANDNLRGVFLSNTNNNDITSNTLNNNEYGIYIIDSSYDYIYDNTIEYNGQSGIYTDNCHDEEIIDNDVKNGGNFGIRLYSSPSNKISENTVYSNDNYGIFIDFNSDYNLIGTLGSNTVTWNDNYGIYLSYSTQNIVIDNEIKNNQKYDLYVDGDDSTHYNHVINNNIGSGDNPIYYAHDTTVYLSGVYSEIFLYNADNSGLNYVTVDSGTEIKNNGIILHKTDNSALWEVESSRNYNGVYITGIENYIQYSYFNDNKNTGITIAGSYESIVYGNTIEFNIINYNDICGIAIYGECSGYPNLIWFNQIDYNYKGLYAAPSSAFNDIYSNNFINNTNSNGWDESSIAGNFWSSNYYSDYIGSGNYEIPPLGSPFVYDYSPATTPYDFWLPPYEPSDPDPEDGAIGVDINKVLSWNGGDQFPSDQVTYDIYFGTDSNPPFITTIGPYPGSTILLYYDPGTLEYNTTYYWKIVADDGDTEVIGNIWSFTTQKILLVYVDDDYNPATPGWNVTHFDKIQEAITAVGETGTVNVNEGVYQENLVIDKSLNLVGENKDTTIIESVQNQKGKVINVDGTSFVNITDFSIRKGAYGIYINSSANVNIFDNLIYNNKGQGPEFEQTVPPPGDGDDGGRNNPPSNGSNGGAQSGGGMNGQSQGTGNKMKPITLGCGIILLNSQQTIITDNNFTNNYFGINIKSDSLNNDIFHNNFIDNTKNAKDKGSNYWDIGYPLGGNYWSNYNGVDEYHGPDQNITGEDGIGDTPCTIPVGCQDTYPFIEQNGWLLNYPPYPAIDPLPENNSIDVDVDFDISWTGEDPNNDPLTYDIYFGTTNPPIKIVSNQTSSSYNPNTMDYDTKYYWKIVTWDNQGESAESPIWCFTTGEMPTLSPIDDAFVDEIYPTNNQGSSSWLLVRRGGTGYKQDTMLKFDLSIIPPGSTISSAKLYLYYNHYQDGDPVGKTLRIHRVNGNWVEETVTWSNQPGYNPTIISSKTVPGSAGAWMDWDVTSSVQDFADGTYTNYGWQIQDPSGSGSYSMIYFISKEHPSSSLHPYLEVEIDIAAKQYRYDDGTTENLLGFTSGGDTCWMHRFEALPDGETIVNVQTIFGSAKYPGNGPGNGTAATVYVWDDPTNDGNPNDCILLTSQSTTVKNEDTDIMNIITLPTPTTVSGEFYVGVMITHAAGEYVVPVDEDIFYISGDAWFCGTNTPGGFNPNNLAGNQYPPEEWGNYWCLRAAGTPSTLFTMENIPVLTYERSSKQVDPLNNINILDYFQSIH